MKPKSYFDHRLTEEIEAAVERYRSVAEGEEGLDTLDVARDVGGLGIALTTLYLLLANMLVGVYFVAAVAVSSLYLRRIYVFCVGEIILLLIRQDIGFVDVFVTQMGLCIYLFSGLSSSYRFKATQITSVAAFVSFAAPAIAIHRSYGTLPAAFYLTVAFAASSYILYRYILLTAGHIERQENERERDISGSRGG